MALNSRKIKRFWYILNNIYKNLYPLDKQLCNGVPNIKHSDITKEQCIVELIN